MKIQAAAHRLDHLNIMEYMATDGILGGVENHVLTLCEHLDRSYMSVAIAWPTDKNDDILQRASRIGIPVYGFPKGVCGKPTYPERTLWLASLLRRKQIHVLHIHACGFTGLNAFIAAQLAQVPAIVVTHHLWFGPRPHCLAGRLALLLEKHLAARAITLYTAQAREMASTGMPSERIAVVPNCVDLHRFERQEGSVDGSSPVFRLITVARMVPGKGHEQLVNVVAQLASRYPNLRLLIVGDGPTRSLVEAQIDELGVRGVVELIGRVANDQVPALLRTAQATALPTYYPGETFPISLIEGMAMGLVTIGTRWAGIPDMIVDGETGFIVEPGDLTGLAAAIEKLLNEPDLVAEMGHKAQLRAQQLFSAETIGRSVSAIYLEAVSANRKLISQVTRGREECYGAGHASITTGSKGVQQ